MKRSTRRRVLLGIGIYFLAAVTLSVIIGTLREDRSSPGGSEWRGMVIVLILMGLLVYGVYRIRVRPRMTAGAIDASGAGLRHSARIASGSATSPSACSLDSHPPGRSAT